jgi:hypothetical protein
MKAYFYSCENANSIKQEYRKLAKLYHPDIGGNTDVMVEINNQYDIAIKDIYNYKSIYYSLYLLDIQTSKLKLIAKRIYNSCNENLDVHFEIVNSILFIYGKTYDLRDVLKSNKAKWNPGFKCWYISNRNENFYSFFDLDDYKKHYSENIIILK